MATTKQKAERFVREVSQFASKLRNELEIDRDDVTLVLRVEHIATVSYNEHEDED